MALLRGGVAVNYGSVCSGIEAATQAWHPLGWRPAFFAEVERFPSAVLAHRYPDVANLGDMTRFREWPDATIDVLVGGTPCQSFSIAGLRAGLDDPRGNLMLTYLAIAGRYRPQWVVFENVPGVLSSGGGRDFGTFLRGLEELGYHAAWRVLDAQFVRVDSHPGAVPQRRRRVFIVGYLGDWRRAAAVLFDAESMSGNPAPRRETGERIADSLTVGANQYSGFCGEPVIASTGDVSHCLNAGGMGRIDYESETMIAHALRGEGFDASEDGTGRGTPMIAFSSLAHGADAMDGIAPTMRAGSAKSSHPPAVAFDAYNQSVSDESHTLRRSTGSSSDAIPQTFTDWQVRRLTPRECERLMGFSDDFTRIPYRGKPAGQCPDGPRYKAIGNSMAVNVMAWIGQRIALVEAAE